MTPTASAAQEWLLGIVRGLVPEPAHVSLEVVDGCGALQVLITVPPKLRGRIIGRNGATIGLVRQLAYVYAQTQHISKIDIVVSEPERSIASHVRSAAAVQ